MRTVAIKNSSLGAAAERPCPREWLDDLRPMVVKIRELVGNTDLGDEVLEACVRLRRTA
jgi:hypothetical protein